jgi:DNA polymerase-1
VAKIYDTLLWEYVKNPWIRGISLDKLSSKEFNYRMISYDEITNKAKINFKDVDLKTASIYSWEDVYITNKLYQKQVWEWTDKNKILENIELPLIEVIKDMEISWVKIQRDKLKEIWLLLENEISRLEKEIYRIADIEFNINSPKQVWEVLFEKLALPKWKKTKTGFSVNAEVLWELSHEFEIAQMIVDYRHYSKLLSTYIEWLSKLLDENDFLHTSYNQAVTTTGRLSSTNPNLQNIPSSHWIAWEIRGAFISRFENGKIIAIDYSQVEVRILAILSWDENLLNAFKNNLDIHHKTAEFLFPWKTITSSERKIAKAVNFWVIYWISGFWLSKMIWISMSDAKIYINKFFESYPKVRLFLDDTIKSCEEKWYVETAFWRKRYINGINDSNKMVKSWAEREAINMPIQWTSADIIKLAMIKTSEFIKERNLKSVMIMQVHDELVFDVYPGEEDIIKKEITTIMEGIMTDTPIKLKTDIWEGYNWRDAK